MIHIIINGTMKKVIIAIAMLLTVGEAAAQQNVKKAMESLMNDKSAVKVLTNKYEHDMGGEEETYCRYTVLQLNKAQAGKMIARMEEAFDKDVPAAYYTMYQTPKIQTGERSNLKYGPELEYGVTFGTKKSHSYRMICTEDPQNAGKRHAYAMVWYDEGGGVRCLLYQIYGRRPGKSLMRLTSLHDYQKVFGTTTGWPQGTAIVDDNNQIRLITSNGTDVVTADAGIGEISDDTDFLLLFGNLRVAFLDAIKDSEKKVLQTGIAMKLLKLCKKHASLLNEREKNTCRESVAEMQRTLKKTNPDAFIDGILVEADEALH